MTTTTRKESAGMAHTQRFRGDWMPDDAPDYPGTLARRWSGGVEWYTDLETARRIVADQEKLLAEMPDEQRADADRLSWDGAVLVHVSPSFDETDRIEPRESDGAYWIGFGWTWEQTDSRTPTSAQRDAWRRLQSALRSEGLEVTGLERREEPDGSDSFPIYRLEQTDERTAGGVRIMRRVDMGRATIHADGSITRSGNAA